MQKPLKTLVIGSGGREHTLVRACLQSPCCGEVIAAPGNGGISMETACLAVDVSDVEAIRDLAVAENIDFAIIGPEVPLCAGAADALRDSGILVYGPGASESRLEGSKIFTKNFLNQYGIPTAASATFRRGEEAALREYLETFTGAIVVKASGLAAGKGVIIAANKEEALAAALPMLRGETFGESGEELLIEEYLEGDEASITLMISGSEYVILPPAQDHKRVGEGDTGENTGGMGAYAPAPVAGGPMEAIIRETIIQPTLNGFKKEGFDFRGTLFIGIMITETGPKVLEFNVRFGDPETQVLLPLLKNDPVEIMLDCARGTLKPSEVDLKDASSMVVVVAADGYPGPYAKGDPIGLPVDLPEGVDILHAGTSIRPDGAIISSGGRVLGVTATCKTIAEAAQSAYAVCDAIVWPRKYYRRDIGWRVLGSQAQAEKKTP